MHEFTHCIRSLVARLCELVGKILKFKLIERCIVVGSRYLTLFCASKKRTERTSARNYFVLNSVLDHSYLSSYFCPLCLAASSMFILFGGQI